MKFVIIAEEFQEQVPTQLSELRKLIQEMQSGKEIKHDSDLMDTADLIRYLKCNRRTIYKYRQSGMPFERKENGKLYFWRSEIDKYFGKK